MFTKTARTRFAAALAFGGLAFAAPAMAAPLSLDAGLQADSGDIHTVQYGYGYGPRHGGWGHHGFGPRHHHHGGWGRGRRTAGATMASARVTTITAAGAIATATAAGKH